MASARVNRGWKYGVGRRLAMKVMVLGVVGLMSLAGTNPVVAASSQDAGSFWTQFTPSSDTRLIFVSSSEGNDSNNGLTPATPVKTLARAESLLRDGFPDWMLLKRGDVWHESMPSWSKSGRAANELLIVGAYGDQGGRPQIRPSGNSSGASSHGSTLLSHVAFVGLHFEPRERTEEERPTGITWRRRSDNILFEDCLIRGFSNNVNVQTISEAAPVRNIRLNGCVIADSWSRDTHSQGLYADGVDGLTIENSVISSNGFNRERNISPTVFNHNLYISTRNENIVVRGNIIADASSHGIQLRCGGQIEDNLFLSNPISVLLGGGPTPREGGVVGRVRGNLIMHGRDMTPNDSRGFGIDLTNIRSATVEGNILYSSVASDNTSAIMVQGAASNSYGMADLNLRNNKVVDWHGSISLTAPNQQQFYRNIRVTGNTIYRNLAAANKPMMAVFEAAHPEVSISGNRYFYSGMNHRPFQIGSSHTTVQQWVGLVEPGATHGTVPSVPQNIGIADYLSSMGRQGGVSEFLALVKQMSRQGYDSRLSSRSIYTWVNEKLPD